MSKTDEKKPKSTDHISHERATSIAGDILKSAAKHKAIADVRQHFAQGGVVDGATSVEPTPEASGPAIDYGQDLVTADNPQASMAAKGMDPLINAAKPTVDKALDFGGNLDNYHAMLKAAMAGNEEAQKGLVDNHLSVAMGSLGAEQPKALKEMIAEGLESSHDLPTLKKNVTSHLENEFKAAIKNADTPETKTHLKDLLSQINKPGSGAVDMASAVEGTPQSLDQAIANSMKTSDPHHVQDYLAQKFTASQFTAPEGAEDHLENLFNNLSKEPKAVSAPNAPTFYSKAGRLVADKMGNTASPEQIKGMLREIKPEEIKELGIDKFLEGKTKVSKEELLAHINENMPNITEITKGGKAFDVKRIGNDGYGIIDRETGEPVHDAGIFETEEEASESAQLMRDQSGDGHTTKFSQYTTPGGSNYREKLYTLPEKTTTKDFERDFVDWASQKYGDKFLDMSDAQVQKLSEKYKSDVLSKKRNVFPENTYHSSHWDEPNVLYHNRLSDHLDSEGKKVLHVDEVQSDWHQAGRDKGYKEEDHSAEMETLKKQKNAILEDGSKTTDARLALVKPIETKIREIAKAANEGVPDAPFKKTWHEQGLKHILREAAENGYDKVTWTTGKQQAARYSLENYVGSIDYKKTPEGKYKVEVFDTNESGIHAASKVYDEKELEATFGKEVAKKITTSEGQKGDGIEKPNKTTLAKGWNRLKGPEDLKVGGEGMKGFYDKMIPDYLNKFAKKYGTKVGESSLNNYPENYSVIKSKQTGLYYIKDKNGDGGVLEHPKFNNEFETKADAFRALKRALGEKVHSLEITPEMRKAILGEGFPRFYKGGIVPSQPAVQSFANGGEVSSIQQAVANDPKQPEPFQEQHQDPATTPIYNLRTGQLGTIPHDQVQDAITSGLYAFPKGAEIQVFNPEGTLGTIPPEKATEAFNAKYRYASPDAQREYNFEKEYGEGAGNSAKAFALGLGNTASFGALNQGLVGSGLASSEGLKQLTERHPYADVAGSLGAFALPFAGEAAGLGAGIEGVSAVGRGVTSAVRGALPEATTTAGKVLSSGIAHGAGSAVEGLAYGAGQAVTENALGNPDDVSQSMMAQIGHTGVLGGVLGGILGAGAVAIPAAVTKASETLEKLKSSPIAETILNRIGELADSGFAKASGKDIEDIKFGRENRETLGTEQGPDQVKAAQTTAKYYREHQNAMREASYAAKKDIRPVETEQLLREVNPDKAYTEFQKTSSLMDEAISELRSEPEIYSQEAARELEKYQERFLGSPSRGDILDITDEGLEKGSIHPNDVLPGTPVDAFKSMDDLKQRLDDSLSQSAKSSDPKVIKSRQQIQSVRSAIRTSLENPEIWGEAGARQAEYNAALSERISAEKAFNSKFTTKISKGFKTLPEASDIKFGSYLKQLSTDTPSAKLASIEKTEILARLQKADANLLDQIEQSYKSMPDRVFDKQAINDLAEKALNSKADFEAQASRQAAFDRLQAGSSGVSVGEALGGVGLHTFGIPLPGAGAAVAAHALATNPYKALQHLAKIESLVQKTTAAIAKGSKSLFQGATQVGEHTAGYLASKLNQGNSYKDYEKKTDALSFIANDPNLLMQKLEKSTESLHANAPNISSALQASTATAVSFLKSKIPDIGPQNPYGPKMLPSKSDIAKFNRYYETVENPLGVFKQMKAGMMTAETIETLEAVYPALYNKMQTQVVDTITNIKKPDFNYKMKMQLSMFLGEDLDLGLHSHAIMSNQMAQNAAAAQKAQDDANFVKPTSKALGNLTASERSLTSTQATATRSR